MILFLIGRTSSPDDPTIVKSRAALCDRRSDSEAETRCDIVGGMTSRGPKLGTVSRRTFVALSAAAPLALGAGKKVPIGLELFSVRDALMKDLPGTVSAVAKMGYEVV